jgi:hypothetical protein
MVAFRGEDYCTFLQVFFFESHPVLDQTQGSGAVFFPDFTEYSNNTSHGIIKWVILLYPQVLMCHSISNHGQ